MDPNSERKSFRGASMKVSNMQYFKKIEVAIQDKGDGRAVYAELVHKAR